MDRFEDYFSNRVKQLTFTFPEDSATSNGARFWSAPKRFPRPLEFSTTDPSHLHFVMAASILRAETSGVPVPDWAKLPKKLAEAVDKVMVPEFQPVKGAKIVTDEKATSLATASLDDAAVISELIAKLEQCRNTLPPKFQMKPIQFEKVSLFPHLLLTNKMELLNLDTEKVPLAHMIGSMKLLIKLYYLILILLHMIGSLSPSL